MRIQEKNTKLFPNYLNFTSEFYYNENHRLELVDFFIFMFGENIKIYE